MVIQDKALLLRAIPYRETSFIYHVLTAHHGRISLLARGIRNSKRRLQAELAPLHHLQLQWQQGRGDMVYLREAERLQPLVPEHYLLAGQTLLALAGRLFLHNHDEHGYSELCAAMEALAVRTDEATGLAVAQWVLLMQGGWAGDLSSCWQCHHAFDAQHLPLWQRGALHCSHCDHGAELDPQALKHCIVAWHHTDYTLDPSHVLLWMNMAQSLLVHIQQH